MHFSQFPDLILAYGLFPKMTFLTSGSESGGSTLIDTIICKLSNQTISYTRYQTLDWKRRVKVIRFIHCDSLPIYHIVAEANGRFFYDDIFNFILFFPRADWQWTSIGLDIGANLLWPVLLTYI